MVVCCCCCFFFLSFLESTEDMIPSPNVAVAVMDAMSSENTVLTADHKSRFGKPVTEPNLAESIKGIRTFCEN